MSALACALFCSFSALSFAEDSVKATTLRGVGWFQVVVLLPDEAKEIGLSPLQLQSDVELRLRTALLPVSASASSEPPFLYLTVTVLHNESSRTTVYSVALEFEQLVNLASTGVPTTAVTWSTSTIGYVCCDDSRAIASVRYTTQDVVDSFISAYLSVNPP